MPDVSSRKFAAVFARALADSGKLTKRELKDLEAAQAGIANPKERAAARSIMLLLRKDAELDSFELTPVRKALGVLIGVSKGPLPKDLEAALENAVPQANVQVKHYDLTFDFSPKKPPFPARAVITLDAAAPADAILEVNPQRLSIASVTAGGKPVPFELRDGRLHVSARGAKAITVDYTVKPDDRKVTDTSFGLLRDKYTGHMWTLTWPYNTGALFPSSSDPADGSTARVTVKVGSGMEAVATGTQQADGSFVTSAEAPAYGIAVYTSPDFLPGDGGTSEDGVKVESFGRARAATEPSRKAYRDTARAALDFYASWLGKFDYGETLKLVEVDGPFFGMEHTAAVAMMMGALRDVDDAKETAAHETAHHWFGDNVRIQHWGDFWMSEGFTNYATFRYFRHAEGEKKFFALLDEGKDALDDSLEENPHALIEPAHTEIAEIFDQVPYQLGPWMLRMMEVELGTSKFDALLRDWYQANRQKAVSTAQFVAFAKKETGHDFGPFFARWNGITAVPRYDARVKLSGTQVEISLDAKAAGPKGLQIPVVLEGIHESKTVLVDPTKKLALDVGFQVTKVRWDPERTVLAYVE